jgi:hypothetical protein
MFTTSETARPLRDVPHLTAIPVVSRDLVEPSCIPTKSAGGSHLISAIHSINGVEN